MLEVKGFRALRFDAERAGSLDYAVTPPYDVITPDQRAFLLAQNPHSMVRVVLPQAEQGVSKYQVAARDFDAWIRQGVLRQDRDESFYLLRQAFNDDAGRAHIRHGFLAVARLPEKGERYVLGHEQTFSGVIDDRFLLTEATRAHLEVIFVIYDDPADRLRPFLNQADQSPPAMTARTLDGVTQNLWDVPADPFVTDFFRDKTLYIADGHHRFGMACAYRDAMRAKENPTGPRLYDFVLMGFVSLNDPGLQIYPTHRLMAMPAGFELDAFRAGLAPWFDVARAGDELAAQVAAEPGCAIGVVIRGHGEFLLKLRAEERTALLGSQRSPAWRDLDVAVLHKGILEKVMGLGPETEFVYERNAAVARNAVARGEFGLAFILKATRAEQIRACAEAGENMPHKSTYFFPKMPSGAAIYRLV